MMARWEVIDTIKLIIAMAAIWTTITFLSGLIGMLLGWTISALTANSGLIALCLIVIAGGYLYSEDRDG